MSQESALYKITDMKVFKNSNKISTVALYFCNAANWNGFSRTFLKFAEQLYFRTHSGELLLKYSNLLF